MLFPTLSFTSTVVALRIQKLRYDEYKSSDLLSISGKALRASGSDSSCISPAHVRLWAWGHASLRVEHAHYVTISHVHRNWRALGCLGCNKPSEKKGHWYGDIDRDIALDTAVHRPPPPWSDHRSLSHALLGSNTRYGADAA